MRIFIYDDFSHVLYQYYSLGLVHTPGHGLNLWLFRKNQRLAPGFHHFFQPVEDRIVD